MTLFPTETFNIVCTRNKNLTELLAPSLFPVPKREKYSLLLVVTFVCTATGKKYYIRGNFTCNCTNVIYLVECINCKCQYVGSATSFIGRFFIHKSDIKTKIDSGGTARHFDSISCHPINPHGYLKVQLIEQMFCNASKDIESILWEREKY